MNEERVNSFAKFHEVVSRNHAEWHRWYYRGHTSPTYRLVPKAGRKEFAHLPDKKMFQSWKLHAVAFLTSYPQGLNDWDLLAIAQHHGLATRMLDWTFNAMTAAFFALVTANNKIDENLDSIVFAH